MSGGRERVYLRATTMRVGNEMLGIFAIVSGFCCCEMRFSGRAGFCDSELVTCVVLCVMLRQRDGQRLQW